MLNDWELSKMIGAAQMGARQPDRTVRVFILIFVFTLSADSLTASAAQGTWQFMSAHALIDPHRPLTVQDELESFFHVLLYYAIRFLPHNIRPIDVAHFLVSYFDSGYKYDEFICGTKKFTAMTSGTIDVRQDTKTVAYTLQFYWSKPSVDDSSQPKPHPIHEIITTMLSWFKAYYSLDHKTVPATHRQAAGAKGTQRGAQIRLALGNDLPRRRRQGKPQNGQPTSDANLDAVEALASSLSSHTSVLELLWDAIEPGDDPEEGLWPENDKGPDLKPKRETYKAYMKAQKKTQSSTKKLLTGN